jgi:hypothetical protein
VLLGGLLLVVALLVGARFVIRAGTPAGAAAPPIETWPIRRASFVASVASAWLAAVDCSTMAAFCRVT